MLHVLMLELKWSAIGIFYRAAWKISCSLKHPVFEWGWKGLVLKKKNRDAIWKAWQSDVNRTK